MADVRRAVRENWDAASLVAGDLVLVAVSGGPDSMALASAAAFEGKRAGIRVGAVVVEHGLQAITKVVAEQTAENLRALGLDPVLVLAVTVGGDGGPEAAAREARYAALDQALAETHAKFVMLGHTLNDQAETVLLGLARGSGARSLSGMAQVGESYLRPLLAITRETTVAFCRDAGLEVWHDPQNTDPKFTRVRIRHEVLPLLEQALGGGVAAALARTADQLREDALALDGLAAAVFDVASTLGATSVLLSIDAFETQPAAIVKRVIKLAIERAGGVATSAGIEEVVSLVVNWHGQKPLTLQGVRVVRTGRVLEFKSTKTLKPGAC
jgi:tRNA(Ile)-lysidine synthase